MYLNFMTFSVCPLRSFYKKLEHPMCLSLILADVFWMFVFQIANFQFLWISAKNANFETILRITVFHVGGYAFGIVCKIGVFGDNKRNVNSLIGK